MAFALHEPHGKVEYWGEVPTLSTRKTNLIGNEKLHNTLRLSGKMSNNSLYLFVTVYYRHLLNLKNGFHHPYTSSLFYPNKNALFSRKKNRAL